MRNRRDEPLPAAIQLALVLARITLWLGLFAVMVVGLFTIPAITLGGSLLIYALWYYVRHTRV